MIYNRCTLLLNTSGFTDQLHVFYIEIRLWRILCYPEQSEIGYKNEFINETLEELKNKNTKPSFSKVQFFYHTVEECSSQYEEL